MTQGHPHKAPSEQDFRDVMAEVCSPVTVVTSVYTAQPHGTTVCAFASLSLRPPMITVALDRSSDLLAKVRASGRLGVNILGSGQDRLAVQFARKGTDKFAGVDWYVDHDLPRLSRAVGWLVCTVEQVVDGGDHALVIAAVQHVDCAPAAPLAYHRRVFGTHCGFAELSPTGQ
jgi:flavin reductase (DIM6/NTAB) family NADH-FMN oxidoreductase RutF